jgi:hypothetical protein
MDFDKYYFLTKFFKDVATACTRKNRESAGMDLPRLHYQWGLLPSRCHLLRGSFHILGEPARRDQVLLFRAALQADVIAKVLKTIQSVKYQPRSESGLFADELTGPRDSATHAGATVKIRPPGDDPGCRTPNPLCHNQRVMGTVAPQPEALHSTL